MCRFKSSGYYFEGYFIFLCDAIGFEKLWYYDFQLIDESLYGTFFGSKAWNIITCSDPYQCLLIPFRPDK